MALVGRYVRVRLSESETRRAVVAVENLSDSTVDLIPVTGYGSEEQLDPHEMNGVSTSLLSPQMDWEQMQTAFDNDVLAWKEKGSHLFRNQDWVGSVWIYQRITNYIQRNSSNEGANRLVRHKNEVYLVSPDFTLLLHPADLLHPATPCAIHLQVNTFYVAQGEFQIGVLLNFGRALLMLGRFEDAIDQFSYAIYLSCWVGSQRGKAFYWRAQARLKLNRGAAALRDASLAHAMGASADTHKLVRLAQETVKANKTSLRTMTREMMKLCEEHLRTGSLDIPI